MPDTTHSFPLRRVFIVEDDHSVRDALVMIVEDQGYACSAFADGERFLEIAQPCNDDVVILDIDLPGCSGPDVAAAMRENGCNPSILVISGLRNRAFEASVAKIKPKAAFRKPLNTDDLLQAVTVNNPSTA